jgi:hypothetical protein
MDILYFLFLGLVVGFWGGIDCARRRIRRHIEDIRATAERDFNARRLSPEEVDALAHAAASDSEARLFPSFASDSEASAPPTAASDSEARLTPSFASAAKQG